LQNPPHGFAAPSENTTSGGEPSGGRELALRLRAHSNARNTSIRTRLEHFITECMAVSRTLPDGVAPLRLKQTEIAQIVGSTPEHLSRLLHQMTEEGALDKTKPPFV